MSLMLKLLTISLISTSLVQAAATNKQIEYFLSKNFGSNPNIKSVDVSVQSKTKIKQMPKWDAFIVDVDAKLKNGKDVAQKMIWFSNGITITSELIDLKSGRPLKESVSPRFESKHYKDENLIYGDKNSKHKVVIFSDPLCPFCREYVPEAIKHMKKQPENFAIYYYHFPLESLHPAAVELTKAAILAEMQGKKDVVLKLYDVNVGGRERNVDKILREFNKVMGTKITQKDLQDPKVLKYFNQDKAIASDVMVSGTPTVFFDGQKDRSKKKYLGVK